MTNLSRRSLITGLISFVAAPAIVRAASLMPVRAFEEPVLIRLGLSLTTIRELLLPGLIHLNGAFKDVPPQWDELFSREEKE